MKAVLIKAAEKKVVAVDVKPDPNRSLEGLRALIGCDMVQPVVVGDGVTIWVDEEGRLKQPTAGFRLSGIATDFAGNGVLLGGDADRPRTEHCLELFRLVHITSDFLHCVKHNTFDAVLQVPEGGK